MALKDDFEKASKDVHKLTTRPTNDQLLDLYANFKQATEGDVKGSRPGFLDIKGRAKYDAWASKKGTPSEQSMQNYIALVNKLLGA